MRDYICIGPSPVEEECAQVGSKEYDYTSKARKECVAFKGQLIREFGVPPDGASLAIKSFPHDFGSYMEVVCYFDDNNEDAVNYCFNIENNTPGHWDDQAKKEILMEVINE
jgi:hypothetical protein